MHLTAEQIKNWRQMQAITMGVYALVMPVEEIEEIRDRLQHEVDNIPEEVVNPDIEPKNVPTPKPKTSMQEAFERQKRHQTK